MKMNFKPNPLMYGSGVDFFSTFRLAIRMKDIVDYDILSRSVAKVMKRYPYFCVFAERVGEELVLRHNERPLPVFPDDRAATSGSEECNGHLVSFGCKDKTIFIDASHYLADGMGVEPLMKSLLYLYVSERFGAEGIASERIRMPESPVCEGEFFYPFPESALGEEEPDILPQIPEDVYGLDPDAFDKEGLYAYHLHIPQKAMMAKRVLNAELAETRISTMMSQIRPHFIYNTLGSIEQLCKLDPPKAGELVHNFSKYLRGNFGELDNPKPILMSQEMEHVHYYINIENMRFPDMTFTFERNSDDFHIPALTIQPVVENAIKHGLMKLPRGGTIRVSTYETDTAYCVSVEDDGAGFDVSTLFDDRKHVGLRNIRERLKVMVNGTLSIESTLGVGTKVLITIPKDVS